MREQISKFIFYCFENWDKFLLSLRNADQKSLVCGKLYDIYFTYSYEKSYHDFTTATADMLSSCVYTHTRTELAVTLLVFYNKGGKAVVWLLLDPVHFWKVKRSNGEEILGVAFECVQVTRLNKEKSDDR